MLKICDCDDNYEKRQGSCVAKEFYIDYIYNGGSMASGVANPTVYTVDMPDVTLNNPIHPTAAFLGWYKTSNFSGDPITVVPGNLSGNLTLYAKWKY